MVSYEEALTKAKSIKPDINICVEYEQGYMFGKNEKTEQMGGGNAPVVILKKMVSLFLWLGSLLTMKARQ